MRRLIVAVLLGACFAAPAVAANTAERVLKALMDAGIPIVEEEVADAETDPNGLLGRPFQYVEKAVWADDRIEWSEEEQICTVEVFKTVRDLNARKKRIEKLGQAWSGALQYQYSKGLVLIRLDRRLTPAQAADYEKVLKRLAL